MSAVEAQLLDALHAGDAANSRDNLSAAQATQTSFFTKMTGLTSSLVEVVATRWQGCGLSGQVETSEVALIVSARNQVWRSIKYSGSCIQKPLRGYDTSLLASLEFLCSMLNWLDVRYVPNYILLHLCR